MINLSHTLQNSDPGYLRMITEAWGFTFNTADAPGMVQMLVKTMLQPKIVEEIISSLPQDAIQALQDLMANDGMLPWAQFTNQHGNVRVMGPAKRDRERPDLYPSSAAEVLWYRGLIGKAFFDTETEPQEYAYIPEDLVPNMIMLSVEKERVFGRPASPKECTLVYPVNDHILDDICTLLAALRMDMAPEDIPGEFMDIPAAFLVGLLKSSGAVESDMSIQPEAARQLLEEERGQTLAYLVETWLKSQKVNELRLLPHLKLEGTWVNFPLETRKFLLDLISSLSEDTWWSLSAFQAAVKERSPDFQRPAGDYDSWFILEKKSGEYLRGRSTWDKVEGTLIRFLICGPMHWLGLVDLARPSEHDKPAAFRLSAWAGKLWHGSAPDGFPAEDAPLLVNMDGRIRAANLTPRSVRYQAARFSEWETRKGGQYIYRVTASSLEKAGLQGLRVHHLASLLKKHASGGIPPSFMQTLARWEKAGLQSKLINATILQVDQPEVLAELIKTPAKRFLGQVLNPTTVEVKKGGEEAVRNALLQIGYFTGLGSSFSSENPPSTDKSFSTNTSAPAS